MSSMCVHSHCKNLKYKGKKVQFQPAFLASPPMFPESNTTGDSLFSRCQHTCTYLLNQNHTMPTAQQLASATHGHHRGLSLRFSGSIYLSYYLSIYMQLTAIRNFFIHTFLCISVSWTLKAWPLGWGGCIFHSESYRTLAFSSPTSNDSSPWFTVSFPASSTVKEIS